jgi:hypothetical protein
LLATKGSANKTPLSTVELKDVFSDPTIFYNRNIIFAGTTAGNSPLNGGFRFYDLLIKKKWKGLEFHKGGLALRRDAFGSQVGAYKYYSTNKSVYMIYTANENIAVHK